MSPPVPPPVSTIDWNTVNPMAKIVPVNGHVEVTYTAGDDKWTTPKLVKNPYLRVHAHAPALNYGMQAFEGMKAVRTAQGEVKIFRPDFHSKRMQHSAETVCMPAVPDDLFMACIEMAVRCNVEYLGPADTTAVLYLRPLLIASGPQLGLELPSIFTFAVYAQPATTYLGIQPVPCLVMEDFDRSATRGTGHAKIGGNYAPTIKHSRAAKAKGYFLTLHLDSQTQSKIDEFSTSAFIGVKTVADGAKPILVVPTSKQIINSVTSDTLQTIAVDLGYQVERRTVEFSELQEMSEVLAVGTAASVLPVRAIVRESTGDKFVFCPDGKTGPVAAELAVAITAAIRGKTVDKHGWLHNVSFA